MRWHLLEGVHKNFKIKLGVYYRERSKEIGRLLEDLLCHIWYDFQVAYGTTSPVPKQPCSKNSYIVPFVLMINRKPVIACYLLQYDISSLFHRFLNFCQLKALQILRQNKHKRVIETVVI